MSGIIKRQVFYDDSDGVARPFDWALVTTGIGSMMEPFIPWMKHCVGSDTIAVDYADQITRIDEIRSFPLGREKFLASDGLHGGTMHPRDGR